MCNVINFSGGRTSAYMTQRLINELDDYIVCFQNTGKEMPATLDFVNECDKRWGLNVVWLEYRYGNNFEVVTYETASRNGRPFEEMIAYKNGMCPNTMRRYCTDELKIQTLKRYLKSIRVKERTIINGIRYDEPRRVARAKEVKRPSYEDYDLPLVKWKITKEYVNNWWELQDFKLKLNEPYGNCDCCFLKGKGKLAIIAKEKPELFDWWIKMENGVADKSGAFKQEITYQQIKDKAQSQLGLWDNDPSFECFCNVD